MNEVNGMIENARIWIPHLHFGEQNLNHCTMSFIYYNYYLPLIYKE